MRLLSGLMKYMENPKTMNVEVAYATPHEQMIIPLQVPIVTTVLQAITQSNILFIFDEIDLDQNKVGIFSKLCSLDTPLRDGDRVEIYRPLLADPKEIRRQRAALGTNVPVD